MSMTVMHSKRIGPATFEVGIDDCGVVVRCSLPNGNAISRIGRPIVCYMEESDLERNEEPGYYVCKSWMSEPSICLNDLSDEEIFEFSAEFGIPLDEVEITSRRSFHHSPAGRALAAFSRARPKEYVGVEEIGAPFQSSSVAWGTRWARRDSLEQVDLDSEAEAPTPSP